MQEKCVWSLGWEDPLEKEMATHSTQLPGESHGQRSLVGYSPGDWKELDMTERLNNSKDDLFSIVKLFPDSLLQLYWRAIILGHHNDFGHKRI